MRSVIKALKSLCKSKRSSGEGLEITLFRLAHGELKYWECWTNSTINVRFGDYDLPPKTRIYEVGDLSIHDKISKLRSLGYAELDDQNTVVLEVAVSTVADPLVDGFDVEREAFETALSETLSWHDMGEWIGGAILGHGFETAIKVRDSGIARHLINEGLESQQREKIQRIREIAV